MQTSPRTVLIVTTSIEEIVPMADDVLEPLVSQHWTGRAQFNLCSLFTLLFGDTEWRLSRLQISSKRFDLTRRHRENEGQFICFTSSPALNCSDNFSTPTTTKHTHTHTQTISQLWFERNVLASKHSQIKTTLCCLSNRDVEREHRGRPPSLSCCLQEQQTQLDDECDVKDREGVRKYRGDNEQLVQHDFHLLRWSMSLISVIHSWYLKKEI